MSKPVVVQAGRLFFVGVIGGILGFPLWWYGRGLQAFMRVIWSWWSGYRARLAVGIWVRHLFVPMYGSNDIAGRVISFFMRLVMIVLRSIGVVIAGVLALLMLSVFLALPIVVTFFLLYHAIGVVTYGR